MTSQVVSLPSSINLRTGVEEYPPEQLKKLKSIWYGQWRAYTDLDEAMIKIAVEEIHTGPLEWPGNKIALGSHKGFSIKYQEIQHEWRGTTYSRGQIYTEAKKRVNNMARRTAEAKEIDDPFAFEYFLTERERKLRVLDYA